MLVYNHNTCIQAQKRIEKRKRAKSYNVNPSCLGVGNALFRGGKFLVRGEMSLLGEGNFPLNAIFRFRGGGNTYFEIGVVVLLRFATI